MSTYDSQTGRLAPQALLQKRYMIVRQAGKGGMGAVYEAVDTRFGQKHVAVKEMSQGHLNSQGLANATAQFQQEAHLLGSLSHPNLPHIFDAFNENGRSYLVMDFIEGKTLHQLLHEQFGQPLPIEPVIQYACQLCTVLTYLHGQKPPIIFRDIKPSNVMITSQGQVFLIDFGIARFFTEGKEQDTTQLGSPGYAPPEQHGSAQTNPRSDIYGLGATLHYCLTGRDPYHSQDHFSFVPIRQVNPQVPVELEHLVQRMVAPDERQRPASANEVLLALQALNTQASAHTVDIVANASAPTLYEMSRNTPPPLQPTILPGSLPVHLGVQQQVMSGKIQPAAAFWNVGFVGLLLLVLVVSAGVSFAVMNLLYSYRSYTGWGLIVEASIIGITCVIAFAASIPARGKLARLLLLLTGLFTLIAGAAALIQGSQDVHEFLFGKNSSLDITFIVPLSFALASLCSFGWMFRAGSWSARILQCVLSVVALGCALFVASISSTMDLSGQANFLWHTVMIGGTIALLVGTLLAARMARFSPKVK